MIELFLRTTAGTVLKAPVSPKPATLFRQENLEWSLRALEALVPLKSSLLLNLPPGKDQEAEVQEEPLAFVLTLPENILAGPVGDDFAPAPLILPTDLVVVSASDEPAHALLTIPETIVEEGPVRPPASKPMPASFQQARRQRYIYDW